MNSEYQLVEKCENDWDKYYDHNTGCYFWWNNTTNESSWTAPKKVIPNKQIESYMPIDEFLGREHELNSTNGTHYDDDIKPRCIRCQNTENVNVHKFCDRCVSQIYNSNRPLLSEFKIECKGCRGWGLDLVQKNGYCNHCTKAVKELKTFENYNNGNRVTRANEPVKMTTVFPPCIKCGGWGRDLIVKDSLCNHCIIQSAREDFEKKVFMKCYVCHGFGLDLVKEDGLCDHCRRIASMNKTYLDKRTYGKFAGY